LPVAVVVAEQVLRASRRLVAEVVAALVASLKEVPLWSVPRIHCRLVQAGKEPPQALAPTARTVSLAHSLQQWVAVAAVVQISMPMGSMGVVEVALVAVLAPTVEAQIPLAREALEVMARRRITEVVVAVAAPAALELRATTPTLVGRGEVAEPPR
jgi:hypothetical protein